MEKTRDALTREAVAAPSLKVLKVRLDRIWTNLVHWKMSLPTAGEWNWMVLKVHFSLNYSGIL